MTRDEWKRQQTGCFFPSCRATVRGGSILDCHEIVGGSDRAKTIAMPAAWLLLCRQHHDDLPSRPNQEQLVMQLAWKLWNDLDNYDAKAMIKLWRPKCTSEFVSEIEAAVTKEYKRIVKELS